MELLLGCGNSRKKRIRHGTVPEDWTNLVTLDIDPNCGADVTHDLCVIPYPFESDTFDEIHAYEVLEHCGQQGDWKLLLGQFSELWRILKPGGLLCGTCPMWDSPWAWGDPGHTRVITQGTLFFLSQSFYEREVGKTNATDYRHFYKGDLEMLAVNETEHEFGFVLKAVK